MKWTTVDPYAASLGEWFAWYPVECADGQTRWLERVYRVTWYLGSWGGMDRVHKCFALDDAEAAARLYQAVRRS